MSIHVLEDLHHPGNKPNTGFWWCSICGAIRESDIRQADMSAVVPFESAPGCLWAYRWRVPRRGWSKWRPTIEGPANWMHPEEKMPDCAARVA